MEADLSRENRLVKAYRVASSDGLNCTCCCEAACAALIACCSANSVLCLSTSFFISTNSQISLKDNLTVGTDRLSYSEREYVAKMVRSSSIGMLKYDSFSSDAAIDTLGEFAGDQ